MISKSFSPPLFAKPPNSRSRRESWKKKNRHFVESVILTENYVGVAMDIALITPLSPNKKIKLRTSSLQSRGKRNNKKHESETIQKNGKGVDKNDGWKTEEM